MTGYIDTARLEARWRTGLALLSVVVLLWVASGFMVNALSEEYRKPYFITYINTGTFTFYLIPLLTKFFHNRYHNYSPLETSSLTKGDFSIKETAILSSQFCILWFLSNLLNNMSYIYTSVASATIISCTSSFFTLIIGALFNVESFTMAKTGALLISLVGVIFISSADFSDDELVGKADNPLLGNIFALASAALYGIYTTLLKVRIGDESRIDTRVFFGFVGLFNLIGLWPILIIFHKFGIESFGWPETAKSWTLLLLNSGSTLVSDFCWVLAMLMTSPLVVTVGLSATIPLSMIGEMLLNHRFGSVFYYIGAGMVLWSFFSINRQSEDEQIEGGIEDAEAAEV